MSVDHNSLYAEIDRLRAALERIARGEANEIAIARAALEEVSRYFPDDTSSSIGKLARAALERIADGDAHHDGAAKFMEIARAALEETK